MSKMRVPPKTLALLEKLRTETDIRKACLMAIDLETNYYRYEIEEPDEYNPKTGKPTHYKWRPGKEFEHNGRFGGIYLGGNNLIPPDEDDIRLHPDVEKYLIANPTIVDTPNGSYSLVYKEEDASGSEQGGGTYYATKRKIAITKLKKVS